MRSGDHDAAINYAIHHSSSPRSREIILHKARCLHLSLSLSLSLSNVSKSDVSLHLINVDDGIHQNRPTALGKSATI